MTITDGGPKRALHGWLILDKPKGLTSTQALGKVRRLLGGKKAGHGGTLDPLATGVLPLAFGEATKLITYVMDGDKEYEFTIRWGEERSTDDSEGEITAESSARPSEKDILSALPRFTGSISQVPPAFSAVRLGGERSYDIARSGRKPELSPRQVKVNEFELLGMPDPDHARLRVSCGKGMYVRSLARDLARFLGVYGHVSDLCRTRVGPFRIEKAISLEKLEELKHKGKALKAMLAIGAALDDIPGLSLTAGEAQRLRRGQSLLIRPQHLDLLNSPVLLAEHQGTPVAIVEPKGGEFRVLRGFNF